MQHSPSIGEIARDLIHTLRDLLWALHEPSAEAFQLLDKIWAYARQLQPISPARIHVHAQIQEDRKIASPLALNAFRIAQEAMRNAVTHAQATHITVTLEMYPLETVPQKLILTLADNGIGFDPAKAAREGHYGLENMRTRAEEAGIRFSLLAAPGKGASLQLEIDLLPEIPKS